MSISTASYVTAQLGPLKKSYFKSGNKINKRQKKLRISQEIDVYSPEDETIGSHVSIYLWSRRRTTKHTFEFTFSAHQNRYYCSVRL